jgi:hypothetical protein
MVMTVLSLPMVLSYPPMHIIISQKSIATGQGCCFTSSSLYPIVRLVTNRGLTLMVFGRWCSCDDVAYCLNPLLGQGQSGESCGTIC